MIDDNTPDNIVQPEPDTLPPSQLSAPQLVQNFMHQNNIELKVTSVDGLNSWIDDGVVLNDKPLLKIVFVFKK